MGPLCAERKAGVVLMHSRGGVGDMASLDHASFPDGVLAGVGAELAAALARAASAGVAAERIVLDPGLGFGKTPAQNVELLRGLGSLRAHGRPLMVGPSRKRFLGELTGRPLEERDLATAAACAVAWESGARLFRVHEPGPARDALAVASGDASPMTPDRLAASTTGPPVRPSAFPPDRPPYRRAALVSLVVLGGLLLSLAPSVTFWDAGEFIAAMKTLGIPHPPGRRSLCSWATSGG